MPESSSLGPVYCPRVMLRDVQISAAIPHCHCCTNLPRCHTLGCNAMSNSSHADVTWNKTQFLQKAISVCQMCQSVAKYFATFNKFLKCSTSSIFKYTIIMISNCSAKQCARLTSKCMTLCKNVGHCVKMQRIVPSTGGLLVSRISAG